MILLWFQCKKYFDLWAVIAGEHLPRGINEPSLYQDNGPLISQPAAGRRMRAALWDGLYHVAFPGFPDLSPPPWIQMWAGQTKADVTQGLRRGWLQRSWGKGAWGDPHRVRDTSKGGMRNFGAITVRARSSHWNNFDVYPSPFCSSRPVSWFSVLSQLDGAMFLLQGSDTENYF